MEKGTRVRVVKSVSQDDEALGRDLIGAEGTVMGDNDLADETKFTILVRLDNPDLDPHAFLGYPAFAVEELEAIEETVNA